MAFLLCTCKSGMIHFLSRAGYSQHSTHTYQPSLPCVLGHQCSHSPGAPSKAEAQGPGSLAHTIAKPRWDQGRGQPGSQGSGGEKARSQCPCSLLKRLCGPGPCGSVVRASAYTLKGLGFDSQNIPGFDPKPRSGSIGEATIWCISLSLSTLPLLKKN